MELAVSASRAGEFANVGLTTNHFTLNPDGSVKIGANGLAKFLSDSIDEAEGDPGVQNVKVSIAIDWSDPATLATGQAIVREFASGDLSTQSFNPSADGTLTVINSDLSELISECITVVEGNQAIPKVRVSIGVDWIAVVS